MFRNEIVGHMIFACFVLQETAKVFFRVTLPFYLEKAMAPQSSTPAWKIPWMEEPGRLQSMGSLRVGHDEWLHFHFSLLCIGEGNGNPLQCSCLENPRDGGAWWPAVYGVTQSRTWLKRLSSSNNHFTYPSAMHEWSSFSSLSLFFIFIIAVW